MRALQPNIVQRGRMWEMPGTAFGTQSKNLYNGNIRNAVYGYKNIGNSDSRGYSYQYDQLNRLLQMYPWIGYNVGTMTWTAGSPSSTYNNMLKYSPDGNIISQLRTATASMDSLSYFYIPNADPLYPSQQSNRLNYVKDQAGNAGLGDLPNQTTGNYTYTANGNLSADASENLAYTWTPSNKLERVIRTIGANSHTFRYTYDAFGNRLSKRTTFSTGTVPNNDTTWYYVRDAQGNPLATYVRYGTGLTSGPAYYDMYLKEHIVYGSERLGSQGRNRLVYRTFGALPSMTDTTRQFLGMMAYEITNHLGNVLATVSDRHIGRAAAPGAVNHFLADILTQTDYYPFGMGMPGRTFSGEKYRYGFNGKENDNEIHGTGNQQDYGMRLYDNRLGRFLSVDPLGKSYPWYSPYQFAGNTPIIAVDIDGREVEIKISAIPSGIAQLRLIGSEMVMNAPKTVSVSTYPMTVTDKVTNTTSTYLVTRDALVINRTEIPDVDGNLLVYNYAFEPIGNKNKFKGKEVTDYPKSSGLYAILLTQNGKQSFPAFPNKSPWRNKEDIAADVLVHVGEIYQVPDIVNVGELINRITGSLGCFTIASPSGNAGPDMLENDINNRQNALKQKGKSIDLEIQIEPRLDFEMTMKVPKTSKN
ncbi:MAG: RHS repeat-associated core domain-containing protein [Saprospiraceae bacterium]